MLVCAVHVRPEVCLCVCVCVYQKCLSVDELHMVVGRWLKTHMYNRSGDGR
jgi:hypothetical protein